MNETRTPIRVGQVVPDFEITTYDPALDDFAKCSLAANRRAGMWTILFFYPADFTFV